LARAEARKEGLEQQGEKEKQQKMMGSNGMKTESCSCWSLLLAQEGGLAISNPTVLYITAKFW